LKAVDITDLCIFEGVYDFWFEKSLEKIHLIKEGTTFQLLFSKAKVEAEQ